MKLSYVFCVCLALMSLHTATGVAEDASTRSINLAHFKKAESLPSELKDAYTAILTDSEAAGDSPPQFSIADASIDLTKGKQEFVMVKSPLTCSAQGACQIDLWSINDGKKVLLMTTTAFNIATITNNNVQTNGSSNLPTVVTNIEDDFSMSQTQHTPNALTNTIQALKNEWTWNGSSYE